MYRMDLKGTKVEINLEPGLYSSGIKGATGKTYLYKLAKGKGYEIDEVVAVTYNDSDGMERLEEFGPTAKLIVIDRYDRYRTKELDNLLEQYAKHAIVLVDIKQAGFADPVAYKLLRNKLEVRQ